MPLKLKKGERFVFAGLTGISLVAVCKKWQLHIGVRITLLSNHLLQYKILFSTIV